MSSRANDILFLVGAGASAEAGIPTSARMIESIESKLHGTVVEWMKFNQLYNHVKSSIHYSDGLRGRFNDHVTYNIETLVNTLYELERNEDHPLYPFIAAWNSRFVSLAHSGFTEVSEFKHKILSELKQWMCPEDASEGNYYIGLRRLQEKLNFPLRVFSLNYDLCIERLNDEEFRIETGFAGKGPKHSWDWERFDGSSPYPLPQVYLYKLHGSIDWKRDSVTEQLFCVEQIQTVAADQMEIIFGRDFKLEAADPYLFYIYEFRKYTLLASLIVIVGYGFADAHINKLLNQCLRQNVSRRILVVCNIAEHELVEKRRFIEVALKIESGEATRVELIDGSARYFLERDNLADLILNKVPQIDAPF